MLWIILFYRINVNIFTITLGVQRYWGTYR